MEAKKAEEQALADARAQASRDKAEAQRLAAELILTSMVKIPVISNLIGPELGKNEIIEDKLVEDGTT